MIISDLSYLEVMTEANSIEGGTFFDGDSQSNSSHVSQHAGDSLTQQVGLVNVNASSNNVAVPIQVNVDDISVL